MVAQAKLEQLDKVKVAPVPDKPDWFSRLRPAVPPIRSNRGALGGKMYKLLECKQGAGARLRVCVYRQGDGAASEPYRLH